LSIENCWVVIPCYNDGRFVRQVVDETLKYCKNVLVVDDGSTDNTLEVLENAECRVFDLDHNRGKAYAVLEGCKFARTLGASHIIMLDADGQHDPSFIPYITKEFVEGHEVVFASRPRNKNMPLIRRLGNSVISNALKVLFGVSINDALSGYKGFEIGCFDKIMWDPNSRYLIESDILINVAKHKLNYSEIFIPTIYVDKGGITKVDGIKILFNILKRRVVG